MADKNLPQIWSSNEDASDEGSGLGTALAPVTKPKTRVPSFYSVLLLNDDFTPMDFVVHVLQKFFQKNFEEANTIMLQVHHEGAGVAGVFSYEIAETKVFMVNQYSKQHKYPLKCTLEKV
jgi:ATP-dependent Clp protease adaptor protein ClpS